MNQSDYKKIAEIIKEELGTLAVLDYRRRSLINALADYFEEKDRHDIIYGMEKRHCLRFKRQEF